MYSFDMYVYWVCKETNHCFKVAIWIQSNRKGESQFPIAEEFLEWVNEEHLLLLAMIADASDEGIVLTRFFDDESHEIADAPAACQLFLSRLHTLFVKANHMFKVIRKSFNNIHAWVL